MKVVADAGPLIALAKIDRLGLLADLFDEVCLPAVVEHEILAKAGPETKRIEAALGRFLRVIPPPYDLATYLAPIAQGLGAGERAVIAVAIRRPPPVSVLMDDMAGRSVARRAGLAVLGLAGLLLMARQRGAIPAAVPLLLAAREAGYWLDDELVATVRRLAKE